MHVLLAINKMEYTLYLSLPKYTQLFNILGIKLLLYYTLQRGVIMQNGLRIAKRSEQEERKCLHDILTPRPQELLRQGSAALRDRTDRLGAAWSFWNQTDLQ